MPQQLAHRSRSLWTTLGFSVLLAGAGVPSPAPQPTISATAFVGEALAGIANAAVAPTSGARATGMVGIHLPDNLPSPLTDFKLAANNLVGVLDIVDQTCTVFVDSFETRSAEEWTPCAGCS